MKRYIYLLSVLLTSVVLCTSCLNSDSKNEEIVVYDDMAITTFKLSAVKRYVHSKTSSGKDTILIKTQTANLPTFTIDQTFHKIYNNDSLPYDSDLKHVLATITASTYSGTIFLKSLKSDTLFTYVNTDSIDFSQPRDLRVFNNTMQKYRSYEVTLLKHQVETNKILWEPMPSEAYPSNSDLESLKEMVAADGLTFIGAGSKEIYAFSADRSQIMVSQDAGATWTADNIDGDLSMLPTENFAFVSYPFLMNDDTDYQLLVGPVAETERACRIWRKVAEYAEGHQTCKWVTIPMEQYNNYYLPNTKDLSLVYFHQNVLAVCNSAIYVSRDGGITWKESSQFTLPVEDAVFTNMEATTDEEGALWFKDKDTDTVWRGVLIE